MNFSAAVKAQLAGVRVQVDYLVEFEFASETVRVWNGFGNLVTSDAKVWSGLANLGRIEGLEQSINGTAPAQTLSLSGVEPKFASVARGEPDEYYRRNVSVFLQFFDEGWQTLDAPYAISVRQMDNIKMARAQGDGGPVYSVSMTAETQFTTRRRPPFSYGTDRDQQLRFPGDLGCERVAGIDGKNITFPDY